MKRTFAEAMAHRRSYYSIGSDSSVLDEEIVHIIREAVKNVPSAFNSQSTRIVLLLGDEHKTSRLAVGSSHTKAFGFMAYTDAMAARCFSPLERTSTALSFK